MVGGSGGRGGGGGHAARDRPRHGGRSRSAAGTSSRRSRRPRTRASSRGRRRRSGRSSCATAINVIPPAQRPRVVLRYGDARDLLVSGLLDGGAEIAQRPMVVDVPVDKGHVVLFSNNPDLARGDAGQLLPGVQRDPELRQPGRGAETGCEIGYPFIARLTARRSTSASKGFCRNGAPVSSRRWSTVTCPL